MTMLVLKDLARFDPLDPAVLQSVHGGVACLTREEPASCHSGYTPPIVIRRGWGECPPIHTGCGPTLMPYGNLHCHSSPVVVPL
jgi:hypothetical protein